MTTKPCSRSLSKKSSIFSIIEQCAGQFARPTSGNILKGIKWLIGQCKPRQQALVAVLGNPTPQLAADIKKAMGAFKDVQLVLVSTNPVTFGGVKAAVNICGPPSMLGCFSYINTLNVKI
jgi:hypothetical protein